MVVVDGFYEPDEDEVLETTEVIEARNLLHEVVLQFDRDVDAYGVRHMVDGVDPWWMTQAQRMSNINDADHHAGVRAWVPTIQEFLYTAFAQETEKDLRAALIELQAQILAWVMDLDRREWVRITNSTAKHREAISE